MFNFIKKAKDEDEYETFKPIRPLWVSNLMFAAISIPATGFVLYLYLPPIN